MQCHRKGINLTEQKAGVGGVSRDGKVGAEGEEGAVQFKIRSERQAPGEPAGNNRVVTGEAPVWFSGERKGTKTELGINAGSRSH